MDKKDVHLLTIHPGGAETFHAGSLVTDLIMRFIVQFFVCIFFGYLLKLENKAAATPADNAATVRVDSLQIRDSLAQNRNYPMRGEMAGRR